MWSIVQDTHTVCEILETLYYVFWVDCFFMKEDLLHMYLPMVICTWSLKQFRDIVF